MSILPRRSVLYAQNFLKRSCLVTSLLDKCDISACDTVYEIGPGRGIVTEQLARRSRRVVAIEKDPELANALQRSFAHIPNVTIHEGDFLHFRLPAKPYKVFANIPFNITSAIVTKLTSAPCPPEDAYLSMQVEAARKFLGQPRETLYAVLLKPWFEIAIVHRFRRHDFMPEPRVDVVMLRLRKRGPPLISHNDRQIFRDFVVYSFTARRPALRDTLKDIFTSRQLQRVSKNRDIDLNATPSSLTFEQWLSLFVDFKLVGSEQALCIITGSEQCLRKQQEKIEKIHRTRRS